VQGHKKSGSKVDPPAVQDAVITPQEEQLTPGKVIEGRSLGQIAWARLKQNKVAMTVYFILASVLPNDRGKALLAYRLKTGDRTALGLAREVIGLKEPSQA